MWVIVFYFIFFFQVVSLAYGDVSVLRTYITNVIVEITHRS